MPPRNVTMQVSSKEKALISHRRKQEGTLVQRASHEALVWAAGTWAVSCFAGRLGLLYGYKCHEKPLVQVAAAAPLVLPLPEGVATVARAPARAVARPLALLTVGIPLMKWAKRFLPGAAKYKMRKKVDKMSNKLEGWLGETQEAAREKRDAAKAKASETRAAAAAKASETRDAAKAKASETRDAAKAKVKEAVPQSVQDRVNAFDQKADDIKAQVKESASARVAEAQEKSASIQEKMSDRAAGVKNSLSTWKPPMLGGASKQESLHGGAEGANAEGSVPPAAGN